MKKALIIMAVVFGLTLSACTPSADTPVCNDDEELVGEECVPKEDEDPILYDDRGLVPDTCDYLENIDDWQPVWCDEFDVDGLPNPDNWNYDSGGGGWGNRELQFYTKEDLDNAFVEDGILHIKAIQENLGSNDYTSARLISKYKGDWLYGRIKIRAKVPAAKGTWSALWMLPTDWQYGGWPDSGEIDIMEHVGYDDDKVHGTIHTAAYNHNLGTQIGFSKTLQTATTEFHEYEMIWEPNSIELFVDGERFATFGYNPLFNQNVENTDAWPFDQRFHLIMNVAVGGNWGGAQGITPSEFPDAMEVDYVRVYQKDYAGMDSEVPSSITELSLLDANYSNIKFMWDHAIDDVMIKEYEIYANQALVGTTTVNAYNITDLLPDTAYQIDVVAVDFAGNRSEPETLNITTEGVRTLLGRIEAESYDSATGVVREATTDVGGGESVGWIDDGDEMEYLLNVEEAGTYRISYRIASESEAGEIKLYGKAILPLNTTTLPITGGEQVWQTVTSDTFTLTEGAITFRIRASKGGFNLNYFEFEKVD
jgi:beta-glucanase (GH16 family)